MSSPRKKPQKQKGVPTPRNNSTTSRALVPVRQDVAIPGTSGKTERILVPQGYKARIVEPAKNYDVVSFARAMNDDFGPRVKKLFDPEREAALQAIKTGIYIGWRCSDYKHDCQRVGDSGKCFCGHLLNEHNKYTARSVQVPCKSCACKAFAWVPSRPEEVGEFWHQRRRNFVPSTWRTQCNCKHTHEQHNPNGMRRCRTRGCGCSLFSSSSVCAACDRHWEQHETFFESAQERQSNGLPVGEDYLPFAEIPALRNMVLTGEDDGDMSYMSINPGPYAAGPNDVPPRSRARALPGPGPGQGGNLQAFRPSGGSGGRGRFKADYD